MTKTLHIVSLPRRGGLEVMFLNFLKELKKTDAELFNDQHVFALNCSADIREELVLLGIDFYDCQLDNMSQLSVVKNILSIVRKHQIKAVYGQNATCNLLAAIVGIVRPGIKVITHEHGTIWKTNTLLSWLMAQFWITFSSVIICNSVATQIYISERFKVKKEKLQVILNGVPFQKKDPLAGPPEKDTLLFIGRLWDIKSVETILEALKIVLESHKDTTLFILGDGPQREELENLSKALEISQAVHFMGYVTDVNPYLVKSTLMIVPSIRESLGNVVIEAAFQGVPSIGSRVDGLSEVIVDHETGRLVEPRHPAKNKGLPKYVVDVMNHKLTVPKRLDPEELAETINDCLDHPGETIMMGNRARDYVTQKFAMDRYVKDILSVIDFR